MMNLATQSTQELNTKYKTTMCKYWQNNNPCPLSLRCHFAHGPQEIRKEKDPLPGPVLKPGSNSNKANPNLGMQNQISQNGNLTNMPGNHKTVKCKFFEVGSCKFGNMCSFAHGDHELRSMSGVSNMNMGSLAQMQQQTYQVAQESIQDQQDFKVKLHQLSFIVNKLEILHQGNPENLMAIKQAKESLSRKDIQSCATISQKIIYDNKVGSEIQKAHEQIVNDAKQIGVNMNSKMSMLINNGQPGTVMYTGMD